MGEGVSTTIANHTRERPSALRRVLRSFVFLIAAIFAGLVLFVLIFALVAFVAMTVARG